MKRELGFLVVFVLVFGLLFTACDMGGGDGDGDDPLAGDAKNDFQQKVIEFVGTPLSGADAKSVSRAIGDITTFNFTLSDGAAEKGGLEDYEFFEVSIEYYAMVSEVVYRHSDLKQYMTSVMGAFPDPPITDATEVLDPNAFPPESIPLLQGLLDIENKPAGNIYALISVCYPYPDTYTLETFNTDPSPGGWTFDPSDYPGEARKCIPMISYFFVNHENKFFYLFAGYDVTDLSSRYTVVEYELVGSGSTVMSSTPAWIKKSIGILEGSGDYNKNDKGTMDPIEFIYAYPERAMGLLRDSSFLGGIGINAKSQDEQPVLFIERTKPFDYSKMDWWN